MPAVRLGYAAAQVVSPPAPTRRASTRATCGGCSTGSVDFPDAFAALGRIGYNGTITFESFSSAVVSPALTRALCIWRETWDDGVAAA